MATEATLDDLLVGDELLVAVLSEFPPDAKLNLDEAIITDAFYKVRLNGNQKYDELFANYSFDEDGVVPYSSEISEGLRNLRQTALVEKFNPTFTYYQLSPGIKIRFQKFIAPRLTDKQIALIKSLSEDMKKELRIR